MNTSFWFRQKIVPMWKWSQHVCERTRVTGSWCLERNIAVIFYNVVFLRFEHHRPCAIRFQYIWELSDIPTADINLQLTPNQSTDEYKKLQPTKVYYRFLGWTLPLLGIQDKNYLQILHYQLLIHSSVCSFSTASHSEAISECVIYC